MPGSLPDLRRYWSAALAATALVLLGNLRIVDALAAAGLGQAQTDDIPDVADHGLANLAMWLAIAAALTLTAPPWCRRLVSPGVAVCAAVLNVLFPPWIIPGAGVLVLVVAGCIARERQLRMEFGTKSAEAAVGPGSL